MPLNYLQRSPIPSSIIAPTNIETIASNRLDESLGSLNPSQRQAATTLDGPLLIIAGAGSGKTRVLTMRVANLIANGVKPWEILALTFTNKAASEMKERITTLCGQSARYVWAGTFHSVFARILRMDATVLGYTSTFSIYDTDESLSVIRGVMNSMAISPQMISPQAIRSNISRAKNMLMTWQEYAQSANDTHEKLIAKVYEGYEKQLRRNNSMDFDDILINMIRLLESSEEMLRTYQHRFSHILVDEYQDTNKAQYLAIRLLAGAHKNLCVVGDDAQSIYRWRGADIRNILDFQKDYPATLTVRLEQNYRSTKTILAAADAVIKHNKQQLPKNLWTDNPTGEQIPVLQARDDRDEADRIAGIIRSEERTHSVELKNIAILYRTNAQSQPIEDALRKHSIAYTMVSGMSFYKRKEVKDTAAYLRLLINPHDSEALQRVINEPARGIGATSLQRVQAYAEVHNISLFQAFEEAGAIDTLMKRAQSTFVDFTTMVKLFRQRVATDPPSDIAIDYIEATGLLRMYKEQHTDEADDRYNNIVQVLNDLAEYTTSDENPSLEEYLQRIALVSDIDEADTSQNSVSVMTLHAAKGLEFTVVILAGVEEGLLPMVKDQSHPDEREEERRLMYVGMTRACERLYITYAERRMRFGKVEYPRPSSFLHEIPEHTMQWSAQQRRQEAFERTRFDSPSTDTSSSQYNPYSQMHSPPKKVSQQFSSAPQSTKSSSRSTIDKEIVLQTASGKEFRLPEPPALGRNANIAASQKQQEQTYSQIHDNDSPVAYIDSVRKGTYVNHAIFGRGYVESVSGATGQQKAVISFDGVGRKNLMVKFAKLTKV